MANQRLLPIKNGYNFRDLGGYPTADGHQIKWHRLIRTGSLARLDQTDLTVLDNIPISLDIDLRAPDEVKKEDGHQIKWHRLIRTGSLARLDQTDLTVLDNIPISLDIDLRAPDEVKKDPDRVPSQAKYYHLPVFEADETDASHSDEEIAAQMQQPGNGYHHMIDVYHRMTTAASAKQAYQKLFNLLLNNERLSPYD